MDFTRVWLMLWLWVFLDVFEARDRAALVHGPLVEHVLRVDALVKEEPTRLGGAVHGDVLGAEP